MTTSPTPHMLTLAEVLAQFDGYTSQEVASVLAYAGKTGQRNLATSCPMAHYLKDVLGVRYAVDGDEARSFDDDALLPLSVCHFVADFDAGRYPDLEDHPLTHGQEAR